MRNSSKSGAFLVEMIIAIAFFAVASAICIRLFVHAHVISTESRDINMAVSNFQSAAECFKAAGGDADEIMAMLPGSSGNGDFVHIYYDEAWDIATDSQYQYVLDIELMTDDDLKIAFIEVRSHNHPAILYHGTVYSYAPSI